MSRAVWECIACGYVDEHHMIGDPPMVCPHCGAEYGLEKEIRDVDAFHVYRIQRLKGTDKLNAASPLAFYPGANEEGMQEYYKVVEQASRYAEEARRGNEEAVLHTWELWPLENENLIVRIKAMRLMEAIKKAEEQYSNQKLFWVGRDLGTKKSGPK